MGIQYLFQKSENLAVAYIFFIFIVFHFGMLLLFEMT